MGREYACDDDRVSILLATYSSTVAVTNRLVLVTCYWTPVKQSDVLYYKWAVSWAGPYLCSVVSYGANNAMCSRSVS